jgi:hypothetical protein
MDEVPGLTLEETVALAQKGKIRKVDTKLFNLIISNLSDNANAYITFSYAHLDLTGSSLPSYENYSVTVQIRDTEIAKFEYERTMDATGTTKESGLSAVIDAYATMKVRADELENAKQQDLLSKLRESL